jgi:ribosomal protein L24
MDPTFQVIRQLDGLIKEKKEKESCRYRESSERHSHHHHHEDSRKRRHEEEERLEELINKEIEIEIAKTELFKREKIIKEKEKKIHESEEELTHVAVDYIPRKIYIDPNQESPIYRKNDKAYHNLTTCKCYYCVRDFMYLELNIRHSFLFVDCVGIIHNTYLCKCPICKNIRKTAHKLDYLAYIEKTK